MESQRSNKAQRHEKRTASYQLCLLASKIDPSCSVALNHLANYSFHSWNKLDAQAEVLSTNQVKVIIASTGVIPAVIGDGYILQIQRTHIYPVATIQREMVCEENATDGNDTSQEMITFTVTADMPTEWIGQRMLVEGKESAKINEVNSFATAGLLNSEVPQIRAESFYILGRLYHTLRDFNIAAQLYEQSLNCNPKMPLAIYGLAQVHMSRDEYGLALEKFQEVYKLCLCTSDM